MRGSSFWDTGWTVGLPWAVWHFPVVIFIFDRQGTEPIAIVGSLAGFSIGIVAAAILQAWFYTRSVFLAMFIHAIFNTLPFTTVLLFKDSPAAVIANLALWAVVIYMKRQNDKRPAREAPNGNRPTTSLSATTRPKGRKEDAADAPE